jgi:phosphatidylethanolamine-binding protein (PEBP) family uncharacterized protein
MRATRAHRGRVCAVAVLLTTGIAGCGASRSPSAAHRSSPSTAATTGTTASPPAASTAKSSSAAEHVPDLDIPVKSFAPRAPLPARYTCDGANVAPPLRWGRVPAGTVEVDLFVTSLTRTGETTEWAVAGLKPRLHSLVAGRLPAGAIVGRNSFGETGYSVCPSKGSTSSYFVLVVPLPHRIPVSPGFEGQALSARAVHIARHEGQMSFEYTRR